MDQPEHCRKVCNALDWCVPPAGSSAEGQGGQCASGMPGNQGLLVLTMLPVGIVVVHFICQLVGPQVPRYLVEHYSGVSVRVVLDELCI